MVSKLFQRSLAFFTLYIKIQLGFFCLNCCLKFKFSRLPSISQHQVLRSPIKYKNSYNDLNALDKRVVSGTGTMAIGCWISLALLLRQITFSFCYLSSKSPSPWNLTLLFCCLLTRYTNILHLKSACPCLPCFAG